ncbi:hypothetical protein THASP1DRAFT_3016, partial [Thamnocephalis sphaerospora]
PSYLHQLPTGGETGTYLAMDLGASVIHVACVSFFGSGLYEVEQVQRAIPDAIKRSDADTFFAFLAEVVIEALREAGGLFLSSMHLGVTWSFRLDQNSLDDGTLVHWSKEFSVSGVEGKDVVYLLQKALDKKGLGIKVISIVNDTVSTLVAGAYSISADSIVDAPCLASCVMGTGTNAAYLERTARVAAPASSYRSFAIATPSAFFSPFSPAYHQAPSFFPQTPLSYSIPSTPVGRGSRAFENMVGAANLGRIVGRILVSLISSGELLCRVAEALPHIPVALTVDDLIAIESDTTEKLTDVGRVLSHSLRLDPSRIRVVDRTLVQSITRLVSGRAARLYAAAIAALSVITAHAYHAVTIAVDGLLFRHYPAFDARVQEALAELLGVEAAAGIYLVSADEATGCVGAALVALLSA